MLMPKKIVSLHMKGDIGLFDMHIYFLWKEISCKYLKSVKPYIQYYVTDMKRYENM